MAIVRWCWPFTFANSNLLSTGHSFCASSGASSRGQAVAGAMLIAICAADRVRRILILVFVVFLICFLFLSFRFLFNFNSLRLNTGNLTQAFGIVRYLHHDAWWFTSMAHCPCGGLQVILDLPLQVPFFSLKLIVRCTIFIATVTFSFPHLEKLTWIEWCGPLLRPPLPFRSRIVLEILRTWIRVFKDFPAPYFIRPNSRDPFPDN